MRAALTCAIGTFFLWLSSSNTHGAPYEINYSKVDRSGWNCYLCEFYRSETRTTRLTSRALVSADGDARFGRETGIDSSSVYPALDMSFENARSSGWTLGMGASNLGLDTESWSVQIYKPGRAKVLLKRHVKPNNIDQNAFSPFRQSGTRLTLDERWTPGFSTRDFSSLDDFNRRTYLRSERTATSLVTWVQLPLELTFETRLFQQLKRGTVQTYRDDFLRTTALPKPIDTEVQGVHSRLNYGSQRVVISLQHRSMQFDNRYEVLDWDSPYDAEGFTRQSAYANAHENESTHFNASIKLRNATRLIFNLSRSDARSARSSLLPYTNNALFTIQPTGSESLAIREEREHSAVSLNHEFSRNLRLQLLHEETTRIDHRPSNLFKRVIGDLLVLGDHPSLSFDFTWSKTSAKLAYRIGQNTRLVTGYARESRTRTLQEINANQVRKVWLEFSANLGKSWRVKSGGELEDRDASPFVSVSSNNPLTRRFHQAARNQHAWNGDLEFKPSDSPWFAFLSLGYGKKDYSDSPLGLQEQRFRSTFLGFRFIELGKRSMEFTHGIQFDSSDTLGSDYFEPGHWQYNGQDEVETTSLTYVEDRFIVASSRLQITLLSSQGTGRSSSESISSGGDFPAVISDEQIARIVIDFPEWRRTKVSLTYVWNKYHSSDWQLDKLDQTSIRNVLSFGRKSDKFVNQTVLFELSKKF